MLSKIQNKNQCKHLNQEIKKLSESRCSYIKEKVEAEGGAEDSLEPSDAQVTRDNMRQPEGLRDDKQISY